MPIPINRILPSYSNGFKGHPHIPAAWIHLKNATTMLKAYNMLLTL